MGLSTMGERNSLRDTRVAHATDVQFLKKWTRFCDFKCSNYVPHVSDKDLEHQPRRRIRGLTNRRLFFIYLFIYYLLSHARRRRQIA